jgi:hypothetical protein
MKAQSSIEYLTTYGWAIVTIALAGAILFTQLPDNQSKVEVSGFNQEELQIPDAAISNSGLAVSIRSVETDSAENAKIVIENPETGATAASKAKDIPSLDEESFTVENISSASDRNTYNIKIIYNQEGTRDLVKTGEITGNIKIINLSPPSAPVIESAEE